MSAGLGYNSRQVSRKNNENVHEKLQRNVSNAMDHKTQNTFKAINFKRRMLDLGKCEL